MGRMLEANEIAEAVAACWRPKALAGVRVLVTAGPTFEAIDAVRGLTNKSSGKMGYAVARAAVGRRRAGDADFGPDRIVRTRASRARRRGVRGGHAERGQETRPESRCVRECRGGRGLPSGQGERAENQEKRPHHDARARAEHRHTRVRRCAAESRLSASASPPRARSSRSTPKRSASARSCRCSPPISRSMRSARTTTRSRSSTTKARTRSPARRKTLSRASSWRTSRSSTRKPARARKLRAVRRVESRLRHHHA